MWEGGDDRKTDRGVDLVPDDSEEPSRISNANNDNVEELLEEARLETGRLSGGCFSGQNKDHGVRSKNPAEDKERGRSMDGQ